MGDVILVTPVFSYLKQYFPDSEIVFITQSRYKDLFRGDPRLSAVKEYNYKEDSSLVFEQLSSQKPDMLIDLQNNRRSKKIRERYFPDVNTGIFKKLYIQRFLLLFLRINLYKKPCSVVERYIQSIPGIQESVKTIPSLQLYCNDNTIWRKHILTREDTHPELTIALFPFSAWKNKQWPLDYYIAIARYFVQKGWRILLFGGSEDAAAAALLKNEIGDICITFTGDISLYDAGCILRNCQLALGNDTGLSHLARACSVKTGIIYGATSCHFGFYPYNNPSYIIFESNIVCRPCHPHGGNHCLRFSRSCLNNIKPEEVINGLEELFLKD